MIDHRSTGLPECGPTETSAPEPCFSYNFLTFLVELQFYVITATVVINFSTATVFKNTTTEARTATAVF